MPKLKMLYAAVPLLMLLASARAQGPPPPITFTAFDFPGATITEAFGINDERYIVGSYCKDNDGGSTCALASPSHGYVQKGGTFSSSTFKPINFLFASNGKPAFETEATGVNNSHGLIVGLYDPVKVPAGTDKGFGYYCSYPCSAKGDFTTLKYPGATSTDLSAISTNSAGTTTRMVGVYSVNATAPIIDHGFLFTAGKFCSIDVPGGVDTNALGINVNGDVVGSYDDNGTVTAFLLKHARIPANASLSHPPACLGTFTTFVFPSTLVSGVTQTEAAGINHLGVIVGNYLDSNQVSHAFWTSDPSTPRTFKTIDPPKAGATGDSAATAINGVGVVVGNFTDTTVTPNKERAFIAVPAGH
jgi:hypothetical protein